MFNTEPLLDEISKQSKATASQMDVIIKQLEESNRMMREMLEMDKQRNLDQQKSRTEMDQALAGMKNAFNGVNEFSNEGKKLLALCETELSKDE